MKDSSRLKKNTGHIRNSLAVGVLKFCEGSFSPRLRLTFSLLLFSVGDMNRGWAMGVMGSIFLSGACLLPGSPINLVLSGELYIPKTSARASLVLIVTVGSAPPP